MKLPSKDSHTNKPFQSLSEAMKEARLEASQEHNRSIEDFYSDEVRLPKDNECSRNYTFEDQLMSLPMFIVKDGLLEQSKFVNSSLLKQTVANAINTMFIESQEVFTVYELYEKMQELDSTNKIVFCRNTLYTFVNNLVEHDLLLRFQDGTSKLPSYFFKLNFSQDELN